MKYIFYFSLSLPLFHLSLSLSPSLFLNLYLSVVAYKQKVWACSKLGNNKATDIYSLQMSVLKYLQKVRVCSKRSSFSQSAFVIILNIFLSCFILSLSLSLIGVYQGM